MARQISGDATTTPFERFEAAMRGLGRPLQQVSRGNYIARCPAHDDERPSLSVAVNDNSTLLLTCFAGCPFDRIMLSVGLPIQSAFPDYHERPANNGRTDGASVVSSPETPNVGSDTAPVPAPKRVVDEPGNTRRRPTQYPSLEAGARAASRLVQRANKLSEPVTPTVFEYALAGEIIAASLRFDLPADCARSKDVRPLSCAEDGWMIAAPPAPRPLYRVDELVDDEPIYVAEGEPCADALRRLGLLGTTSFGGSKAPHQSDWSPTAGRVVIIIVDRDSAGEAYGAKVAQLALEAGARRAFIIRPWEHPAWTDLAESGDIADLLERQNETIETTQAKLAELVARARPVEQGAVEGDDSDGKKKPPTTAQQLVKLASSLYTFGNCRGEVFAIVRGGPNVAIGFKGSQSELRSALSYEYLKATDKVPNSSALGDALSALAGAAQCVEPTEIHTRVAWHDGRIVVDLGDKTGRAVIVGSGGWSIVDRSPVTFKRTALTKALPVPTVGGNVNQLRELLNVNDTTWRLIVGWMVAALVPDIAHPVLMLGGEQGTGKTTAATLIAGLIDPSNATHPQPKDPESWAIAAAGSWIIVVDNISSIPAWWSDAVCKTVTGDGWIRRTLYTNSELTVLSFRRCVVLTSIDAGSFRGDLADRMLLVDLETIGDERRRGERELRERYAELAPALFGALLDLLARMLTKYHDVTLEHAPRMADFARVLAALDAVSPNEPSALEAYLQQRDRIAGDVVAGDLVATAIADLVEREGGFDGSATELLERVRPRAEQSQRRFPQSASTLGSAIKRVAPALKRLGILVEHVRTAGGNRARRIVIRKALGDSRPPSPTVPDQPALDISEVDRGTAPGQPGYSAGRPCPAGESAGADESLLRDGRDSRDTDSLPLSDGCSNTADRRTSRRGT